MARSVQITRVYHFSAAHQLASAALSSSDNAALYGACHRPHGHNYYLEVTVAGTPDARTGMAVDLEALDGHVRRTVLDQVDHAKLEDAPALAGGITTAERRGRRHGSDPHVYADPWRREAELQSGDLRDARRVPRPAGDARGIHGAHQVRSRTPAMKALEGKTAIVTGAGRG